MLHIRMYVCIYVCTCVVNGILSYAFRRLLGSCEHEKITWLLIKQNEAKKKKRIRRDTPHTRYTCVCCMCVRACTSRSYVHSKNKNIFLRQPVQNKSERTRAPLSCKSLLPSLCVYRVSIAIRNISLFSTTCVLTCHLRFITMFLRPLLPAVSFHSR